MKILVLSDSHSGMHFMRRAIRAVQPDAVIHLGDYFDDAATLAEENPQLRFHMVPGNCDLSFMVRYEPEILCYDVCGVRLYMTHGHKHEVKRTMLPLLADARAAGAAAVLYGHTHVEICYQEDDGLWVLNPGSCRSSGGSVGLIETEGNMIKACRLFWQADLEGLL